MQQERGRDWARFGKNPNSGKKKKKQAKRTRERGKGAEESEEPVKKT